MSLLACPWKVTLREIDYESAVGSSCYFCLLSGHVLLPPHTFLPCHLPAPSDSQTRGTCLNFVKLQKLSRSTSISFIGDFPQAFVIITMVSSAITSAPCFAFMLSFRMLHVDRCLNIILVLRRKENSLREVKF